MTNAFSGLFGRLGMVAGRLCELDIRKIKTSQTEWGKKQWKTLMRCRAILKDVTHVIKILEREDRAEVFESIMVKNFLKLITEIKGKSRNFREFK